jgi:hypothetical protein
MHHFRVLALAVEQRQTGAFDWVLLESFDDVEAYAPLERSSLHYASRSEAFEAGNKMLIQHIADGGSGPIDGRRAH